MGLSLKSYYNNVDCEYTYEDLEYGEKFLDDDDNHHHDYGDDKYAYVDSSDVFYWEYGEKFVEEDDDDDDENSLFDLEVKVEF